MEKWTITAKRADFNAIAAEFGIDPVIARIIRNRDVIGHEAINEYLNGGMEYICDPFLLQDMDLAVRIMQTSIDQRQKIRVIGDYDIDGIMSSYILKRGLEELGACVDVRIPNRIADGYGMNVRMIDEAYTDGIQTIITCDNGISAEDAVKKAREYNMTVIVTDHHEVLSMPPANAVIDPKREDDHSPNQNLCGAAVAWKFIRAMGGDKEQDMLQYAAFATIGDIVSLTGENRVIVKEGIKRLRKTDNIGLRILADINSIDIRNIAAYHIGFVIGPCLNASGRLDTAMRALRLLETKDPEQARAIAEELKDLNASRKAMTEEGVRQAVNMIETTELCRDRVLVVYLPGVHESIAGIIAGKLREKYSRPVYVLTMGENCVKGSGRSIEQYDMFEELVKVSELMIRFGGHKMAAGFSLEECRVDSFRKALNETCTLTDDDLIPRVKIDVPMPVSYVTDELIEQLELLQPFGKDNDKPVFAQKFLYCDRAKVLGQKRNCLKMRMREARQDQEGKLFEPDIYADSYEGIAFGDIDDLEGRIRNNPYLAIVYEPEFNYFGGRRTIQFRITHYQ